MAESPPPDTTPLTEGPRTDGLPEITPDFIEQDFADTIDNIVPTRGYQMVPMVALGGSAGSIAALQEFFKAMSADSGMVFIVILHLSPTHESTMPELLSRFTPMPVVAAKDREKVHANHVYVIPPGKHLATVDGHLRLTDLETEKGKRVAVDLFFRSLADTHGPHAAAIVLSGADGDGALGIKRIKERGGLTIAQDPDEAEHSSMPRTAIDTGMVDWILEVGQMPERLLTYIHREKGLKLPSEDGPQPAQIEKPVADAGEAALREVLVHLRTRTGRDFSYYKRATILRRLARRMQVNGVEDLPGYLAFMRTHPGESGALLQDLPISVTNFFRDRDAFITLENYIPSLFEGKTQADSIRVWVAACATGEEAYSIAMLLLEHARKVDSPPALQVFACDLDEEAVAFGRAGLFPLASAADVSEERLKKFFIKEHHGFRVRRELREMVLFATHDLLKDAPFSRMDLVTCRNLLIYLNRPAQKRALDTFHFALRPGGLLFLGSSESVEEGSMFFRVEDKKSRIYRQRPAGRATLPAPAGSNPLLRAIEAQERLNVGPIVHARRFLTDTLVPFSGRGSAVESGTVQELHFKLIERFAPPSLIVNSELEIVHLSEKAGRFLQYVGGEPTANLLRAVHPLLRIEMRSAIHRCVETNAGVQVYGLPFDLDGEMQTVDLHVLPAQEIAPGFLLVVFALRAANTDLVEHKGAIDRSPLEPVAQQLERELEQVKSHLRDTVEQYEASTEEMKASNEELQAMNEELRSATEELETSREELQSINEELTTVNAEMKNKVDELATANSDLQNLMAATSIATVFLDRELTIKRYTPTAIELFHLIPGDLGRPLANLQPRIEYPELIADAEQVLRTLIPIEREVRGGGRWFLARLQPYRTTEDHIAGIVLTFVDVTQRKTSEDALREQLEELARFNAVAVGRETRMIELKKEINTLAARLGESRRYPLEFEPEESA